MRNFRHCHVVYKIDVPSLEKHKPFYIGCCRLGDLPDIPDAWQHPTFYMNIKNNTPMILTVIEIFGFDGPALQLRLSLATVLNVWINLNEQPTDHLARGIHTGPKGAAVRNITTGAEYPSAAAAARAMNVTPSAMSAHLSGNTRTLKGYRFERC